LAGFPIRSENGFTDGKEAACRLSKEDVSLIILCSSDDLYPDWVPPFASTWKFLRPEVPILLAGYPQDHLDSFRLEGVDDFIHIRSNALETLEYWMKKLGILV
jgi:methylmalonyl-CoA mutase